jgi:hypothetical protein
MTLERVVLALKALVAEQAFLGSVFECVNGLCSGFYSFTLHYVALRGVGWMVLKVE